MTDEDLEIVVKALFSNVEWQKAEGGIAVRPVNNPASERIVEMSADVRDRVWEWLHNPKVVDREEWAKVREPIRAIIAEVTDVILRFGSPLQREVFKKEIEEPIEISLTENLSLSKPKLCFLVLNSVGLRVDRRI
ncbi:MAG: hypothetical protein QXH37_01465 [Candidatus Bathyarchaeia archaeon]